MKEQSLLSAAFMAAVFVVPYESVQAQVQVVESNNRLINNDARSQPAAPAAVADQSGGAAEVFYQMQLLQQEVAQLRGLLEEQGFEIKRLKQQRLDDYLNLDKRLSALSANAPANPGVNPAASVISPQASVTGNSGEQPSGANEAFQYRAAIDLILKKKDYVKAQGALQQYLTEFPEGKYAANCQYWLGELALLGGDLEKSREWFAKMVNQWPEHPKVADANYKLGTVYHKLGDQAKAKQLLEGVADGNSNASRLARSYLKANF